MVSRCREVYHYCCFGLEMALFEQAETQFVCVEEGRCQQRAPEPTVKCSSQVLVAAATFENAASRWSQVGWSYRSYPLSSAGTWTQVVNVLRILGHQQATRHLRG